VPRAPWCAAVRVFVTRKKYVMALTLVALLTVVTETGTVCRGSAGVCDPQEVCDGTNVGCPGDTRSASGTVVSQQCGCFVTRKEVCDGTNVGCPADSRYGTGTVCRGSAGVCDPQEVCDGTNVGCPRRCFPQSIEYRVSCSQWRCDRARTATGPT